MLNASITLKGAYPIVAEARWLPEPRVVLESLDIGATIEPLVASDVLSCADPADPFCLPKAALCLRGLIPADEPPNKPLKEVLGKRGGIHLITQTSIPRGSGLGTSSILAGAVLSAVVPCVKAPVFQFPAESLTNTPIHAVVFSDSPLMVAAWIPCWILAARMPLLWSVGLEPSVR